MHTEGRFWRNKTSSHASIAVSQMRRNGKFSFLANCHVKKAFVPSFDDLALAHSEAQRLATLVAGIKFLAVGKGSLIMSVNCIPALSLAASFAFLEHLDLETFDVW